ncbi:MAG TPA: arginine repressor [Terriglobales bacterium]|nr:arginine repressor [Terriglobales bacterium]
MSKLSRHAAIRNIVAGHKVSNQDELRRLLYKTGHRVTQATLSRDLHELELVKTAEGYALPQQEAGSDPLLPSVERLIHHFVYEVKIAQNIVVVRTSAGSAQPVAAAIDAEEWPEVVGTVGGDDTIFIVAPDNTQAERLARRIKGLRG